MSTYFYLYYNLFFNPSNKKIDVNFLLANITRSCGGAPFWLERQILFLEVAFKPNYSVRQKALCLSRLRFFSPKILGNGIHTLF
jgi:hypothetical protein